MARASLPLLLKKIRSCTECAAQLPRGPRPVVQWGNRPRIVIIGQAPGTLVHESGIPWNDPSGDHLRSWLNVTRDVFYDGDAIGLMPMGFCYPGKKAGGDAPPDARCAPKWHAPLLQHKGKQPLILLVGSYAQAHYLEQLQKKSLTATVQSFEDYLPDYFPLPHPSWRSKIWMKKNPWFMDLVLPRLQGEVASRI